MKEPFQLKYRRDIWKLFITTPVSMLGGVAEIGVAEGNYSEDLLKMPMPWPRVYLVDRWQHAKIKGDSNMPQSWHDMNLAQVQTRTAPFSSRVRILKGESREAAHAVPDASLSLVYVDADHSYNGVKSDCEVWFPKVKKGGFMAFHDYQNPAYGVKKAVQEFAAANNLTVIDIPEDKAEDAGAYFQC